MEMRARRDLFVVIFLCFFLLLTAFLRSQSMLTAAIVLAAVAGLLAAMMTMQFRRGEMTVGRRLRAVGAILLQALPVAAVFFVLFPRPEQPLWGLGRDEAGARTGLSETMTPGGIAELSQSDSVAFRVLFDGEPPHPSQLYWRGPVLGHFDGKTWRPLARPVVPPPPPEAALRGEPVRYTLTLEPSGRNWLLALELAARFEELPGARASVATDFMASASRPVVERTRYTAVSWPEAAKGLNESRLSLQNWLELPPGFNRRTLELAARWQAEDPDPARLVERALAMFRDEPFRYTFKPPLLGRDSVDDFLFGTRAGFCEHYSSAFVVLMRALDIPARVVTGYMGGERNPVDGYWIVRQADAHAWAEVWLAGQGWVRVDPTAAVAPERIERGARLALDGSSMYATGGDLPLLQSLAMRLDALANAWNQWVLTYDGTLQKRLLSRLGIELGDWKELAALLAAALAVLLGGVALLTLHPRRPRDPVERAYADFCDKLALAGPARMRHETSWAYLNRVERLLEPQRVREARDIVSLYNRVRYAGRDREAEAVRKLRRCVRAFKP